ncbi:MAG: polyprenyl synthetase family protein [Planctomycetes bacterium]|nr:polyprenyl synthetase family protein [Planctomycetota bacterium]
MTDANDKEPTNDIAGKSERYAVPLVPAVRAKLSALAASAIADISRESPLSLFDLERLAREIVSTDPAFSGFNGYAMICINNEFWQDQFAATPCNKRILLLPRCLGDSGSIIPEAEKLGYHTLIAEGTPQVLELLLSEKYEAVLGVACMDSLEKAFSKVSLLGVPNMAVPLLADGCVCTDTDRETLHRLLNLRAHEQYQPTKTYLPMLRETRELFAPENLARILDPDVQLTSDSMPSLEPAAKVEKTAIDWLEEDGKRLRPFITLSAYMVSRHGDGVLEPGAEIVDLIPDSVRSVSLAIEALHKASLVHDDIEDNDPVRYGKETLHLRHGIPFAINTGDYLVGLGYRLIAREASSLGARCISDIIEHLSNAHLKLCKGQGAELLWWRLNREKSVDQFIMKPIDALSVYAAKTASAFETAIYSGLRMGECNLDIKMLKSFSRAVGVGFQIINDLKDFEINGAGEIKNGFDTLSMRPTLLYAFAIEDEACRDSIEKCRSAVISGSFNQSELLSSMRDIYERAGVFVKAESLINKYSKRALALANEVTDKNISRLLSFLAEIILRR